MRADYLTYRRALTTAIIGLIGQVAIAIVLLIYARMSGGSHAAVSAAITVGIGATVWLGLILLFDQHRRERLESMEAESLAAAESVASSAFEGTGEEIRVAARRLRFFRKFVLPGLSLLVATLLIVFGLARFATAQAMEQYVAPDSPGWGVAIGLGLAFVGFVFARYVSGMAKEHSWAPLRAGSAQAVLAALLGFGQALVLFIDLAGGPDTPAQIWQYIVPVAMVIGGIEIGINFVLDLYRPRSPGEPDRPAFDSRILGFVAAPDKIAQSIGEAVSYQLGVDVTGSWLYQLLSRSLALFVLIAAVIAWALSSLVVIQPHQRGLVLTLGRVTEPLFSFGDANEIERTEDGFRGGDIGPGLHVKWPWPISRVSLSKHVVEDDSGRRSLTATTTGIQVIHLGGNPPDEGDKPIIWGEQHAAQEIYHIVRPARDTSGASTGDAAGVALVAVEVPLHYRVDDVQLYERVSSPGQQQDLLTSIGRRVVSRYLSRLSVDEILAADPAGLADDLRAVVEEAFSELNEGRGPGVKVLFVGVNGVHPPRDVADKFEAVVQALQERETAIERARTAQIRTLAGVAGEVDLASQIADRVDELEAAKFRLRAARRAESDEVPALTQQVAEIELDVQALIRRAGGQAGELLARAGTDRWIEHMGARARWEQLSGEAAVYRDARLLYRTKAYNEALLDLFRDTRLFITTPGVPMHTILELQDRRATLSDLNPNAGAEGQ